MNREDKVQPPAAIFYGCLPNVERGCDCSPADRLAGRDCGVVVARPKQPKREGRR
jgi:hypothetical protein